MSSGYRGILRYDQVIRIVPDYTTTEGILLPNFPNDLYHDDLRLIKPVLDWIWIDLWAASPIWVEYNNGVFILHAIDIPAVNTVAILMTPDLVWRLAIDNGTIYLMSLNELKENAFNKKLKSLKDYATRLINLAVSIRGTFFSFSKSNSTFILSVATTYNTHLTNLLNFTTYDEIVTYNISVGWPAWPA